MKILLIDDSTMSRNLLKRSLGQGYEFLEAENGMRGLELYFLEKPDLVFLDITMPGASGLEILEQLHQMDPKVRVIIGSADIQDFSKARAAELGAAAYLTKPFSPETVQTVVDQVMGRSSAAATQ
jgi:two-component system, chemotaxis family, chemotaxis protein CheY